MIHREIANTVNFLTYQCVHGDDVENYFFQYRRADDKICQSDLMI